MPACLEQEVTAEEIGETCQEKKVDRLQSGIPYVNLRCDCTSKTSPLTSDIIASRCLRRFRVGRPGTRLKGNGAGTSELLLELWVVLPPLLCDRNSHGTESVFLELSLAFSWQCPLGQIAKGRSHHPRDCFVPHHCIVSPFLTLRSMGRLANLLVAFFLLATFPGMLLLLLGCWDGVSWHHAVFPTPQL